MSLNDKAAADLLRRIAEGARSPLEDEKKQAMREAEHYNEILRMRQYAEQQKQLHDREVALEVRHKVEAKLRTQLNEQRKILDKLMEAIRDDLREMKSKCGPDCVCTDVPSESCKQNKLPRTMRALVMVALESALEEKP